MALRFPAEVAARRRANALEQQARYLRREGRFPAAADAYDVASDAWEVAGDAARAARARELAGGFRIHGGKLTTVRVLFRRYPLREGHDVIAILPDYNVRRHWVTIWSPGDGHGEAPYLALIHGTRPATPIEYAPILAAMRRMSYDPIPIQRWSGVRRSG